MKKSNIISENLRALQLETSNLFSELIKEHKSFNFLKAIDEDYAELTNSEIIDELKQNGQMDVLPLIEFRSDITGNVFDCYITEVTKDGNIRTLEMEDYTPNMYVFSDLGGIEDQLVLLNEMEELID